MIVKHLYSLHMPMVRSQHSLFRYRHKLLALLVGVVLFSLGACSAGASPATVPPQATVLATKHPTSTPTALPAGTVLYQADWSYGLASWQGMHGWKAVQGQIETDSSAPTTLTIPYRPPVTDYTIEIHLQIVRLLKPHGGYFSIFATRTADKDGFQAVVSNLEDSGTRPFGEHPYAQVYIDPYSHTSPSSATPIDYEPGFQWHTYRVAVQGNEVRLLDDDVQIGRANSEQTTILSNGPLGLSSGLIVLRVSSLRITAL